jgi:hypothetical protein
MSSLIIDQLFAVQLLLLMRQKTERSWVFYGQINRFSPKAIESGS